jgi:multidrug efflux pump subunit AcrB
VAIFTPITFILLTVGLMRGGIIQFTFFPAIAFDSFQVQIAFTPGSGEERTMEYLKRFDDIIWDVNNELREKHKDTADFVNYTFLNLGSAFDGLENGSHAGNINVLLRDMEGAPVSSFQIAAMVRERIGDIPEAKKVTVAGRNRFGAPVSISLLGKNLQELKLAKEFLKSEMKNIEALNNITDNNAAGKQEVLIKLKPKAYFLGMNHASISNQLRQGFYGGQAQRLQDGKDELRVWVRYPKSGRLTLGQLEQTKIKTPAGEYPLTELVDYTIERGPVNIKRFNASREIRLEAELVDPYEPVPPILEKIEKDVISVIKAQYPGVRVFYQGQQRDSAESMADLGKYYSIAFAIIVLIVMIHFKSFSQGLIIILMIPLGWLGSIWGHGIQSLLSPGVIPVSILSIWGMVALSGVIINDAVVFLAKYNSLLLEGYKVHQAAYLAGLARFRAIVLTTLTTTIGLYPLILEKSFQAQFLIPMAVSLAYGVFVGTAFILLFFPVLITITSDIKVWVYKLVKGESINPEKLERVIIHSKRTIE